MNNNLFMGSKTIHSHPISVCWPISNPTIKQLGSSSTTTIGSRMHDEYSKDILPDEMQKHMV